MRPVRDISAIEQSWIEKRDGISPLRCSGVEPEPVGTIVMKAFRVTGYDNDCDGSLMARLAAIDSRGDETGWTQNSIGLNPDTTLVVTPEELKALFARTNPEKGG